MIHAAKENDIEPLSSAAGAAHAARQADAAAYRVIFGLAAIYNLAFGLWAACYPQAFFTMFDLPPPIYPSIWSCLGMVVGLYGFLYLWVAWRPNEGQMFALVGLAGKVMGPCGWLVTVGRGELPPRTFPLILANDLVWWFPFLFYLLRGTRWRETLVVGLAVIVHLLACAGLLFAAGGTEIEPELAARAEWISQHQSAWVMTWAAWSLSSLSLGAFFLIWTRRLRQTARHRAWLTAASVPLLVGVAFDLAGETTLIARATERGLPADQFAGAIRAYHVLSPGIANGLYCVAGLLASLLAWRSGWLRGPWGVVGILMWTVGLALTAAAALDHRWGTLITGAGVMALFIPWSAWIGWKLRP